MDKLIFLDCDGVISTLKSGWHLDPEKLELLGKILEATGARIVVSSSWRWHTLEQTLETTFKSATTRPGSVKQRIITGDPK